MKRIYIAGPGVFRPNPAQVGEELKALCLKHGLDGQFPMDAQLELPQQGGPDAARMIYGANVLLIRSSDAVIADMTPFRGPSMDVGTAFEIGYADALGLPVFGYSHDHHDYYAKVMHFDHGTKRNPKTMELRDSHGDLVEEFGLIDNLMMCSTIQGIVHSSFEGAVRAAAAYFGVKK